MAEITAGLVKELRETTGAGMMDCKKALVETEGDIEAAIDWLRKKGLSAAAKKAGRTAAEGLVSIAASADDKTAAVVEINAETDFVGRNEAFQAFVQTAAKIVLENGADVEVLKALPYPNTGRTVAEELTQLIATVGENMSIRRAVRLSVASGTVATYMHTAIAPNLGRIGVLVALESSADQGKLNELGKQIAMHIAAARPDVLKIEQVATGNLDRERAVLTEQARASGKPDDIIAKMVEGRIKKYYEEVVLLEQTFVIDGETKIGKVVENAGKTLGQPVVLADFARFHLGEGIEKEQTDFAAEVAAQAKMAS
jgi:elongation factor Ts